MTFHSVAVVWLLISLLYMLFALQLNINEGGPKGSDSALRLPEGCVKTFYCRTNMTGMPQSCRALHHLQQQSQ